MRGGDRAFRLVCVSQVMRPGKFQNTPRGERLERRTMVLTEREILLVAPGLVRSEWRGSRRIRAVRPLRLCGRIIWQPPGGRWFHSGPEFGQGRPPGLAGRADLRGSSHRLRSVPRCATACAAESTLGSRGSHLNHQPTLGAIQSVSIPSLPTRNTG